MTEYKVCNSCGSLHLNLKAATCAACARKAPTPPRSTRPRPRARTPYARQADKVYGTTAWSKVRTLALQRDGYRCQHCGANQALIVHHDVEVTQGIDPYDLTNLETLCRGCHGRLHARRRAHAKTSQQKGGFAG
jgi:5-methylcytosine-specific restriction protein A